MLEKLAKKHGLDFIENQGSTYIELADGSIITEDAGIFIKWVVYSDGWPSNSPDFGAFEAALRFVFPEKHGSLNEIW